MELVLERRLSLSRSSIFDDAPCNSLEGEEFRTSLCYGNSLVKQKQRLDLYLRY